MLTIQLLPAKGGDCLWIEYGEPGATQIVIIDGGEKPTIDVLKHRIASACRERNTKILDVELIVVTHIDNDHIEGVLELLAAEPQLVSPRDVWFNGRAQLLGLDPRDPSKLWPQRRAPNNARAGDLLGGSDEDEHFHEEPLDLRISPADLLGPAKSDRLSSLLRQQRFPWNRHEAWAGRAVVVPDEGLLPQAILDGGMRLTLLGPTTDDLYRLCATWPDVLSGHDEPAHKGAVGDALGELSTWPPMWNDKIARDSSRANGSSIVLLAEYGGESLLLSGDCHAPALAEGLSRAQEERGYGTAPMPLSAFKVSHHGSSKNVSRDVIERLTCARYLISTDGIKHRHPDHQTMLRILKYSKVRPEFCFNYESEWTTQWRDRKSDLVHDEFQDYTTTYPQQATDGLVLSFGTP